MLTFVLIYTTGVLLINKKNRHPNWCTFITKLNNQLRTQELKSQTSTQHILHRVQTQRFGSKYFNE